MPDPPRRAGVDFPPLERQGAGAAPRGGCFPARGSIHPRPLRQGRLLASRAATAARCCFCCCGGGGGGGASSRRCSSDNPSGLDPPASSAVSIRVLPRGIPPAGSTPGVGPSPGLLFGREGVREVSGARACVSPSTVTLLTATVPLCPPVQRWLPRDPRAPS